MSILPAPKDAHSVTVEAPEEYRYVLCWNGGQASYNTLGETFADAGDRVKRGESVHIYPILNGGA